MAGVVVLGVSSVAYASPVGQDLRSGATLPASYEGSAAADAAQERTELEAEKRDAREAARLRALRAQQAAAAAQAKAAADALAAAQADPKSVARTQLASFGWGEDQYRCLDTLWVKESNWRWAATNPTSGAYGIAQALPAEKMATAGADWRTNPATQISWGLGYIRAAYGTPCSALNFHLGHNWY